VLNGTSLQLRGVLSGTTVRNSPDGLTCSNLNEEGLYSRFEAFQPEMDPFVRGGATLASDDAPNRFQDVTADVAAPLNTLAAPFAIAKRIDTAGDVDLFRFTLTAGTTVHAWTTGGIDTVGSILDSRGVNLEANDDESAGSTNFNFGITRQLAAGTYYVQVTHFEPSGTGAYTLNLNANAVAPPNYTDLWWKAAEPGWGLNLNHQGTVIFGTLFTYDASGAPMWLVLARGDQQADGSFMGTLYRTTGPAFNAVPWSATTPAEVGSMRVAFSSASAGTLTYSVDGVNVTKAITREVFGTTQPACTFTSADRASATNYQDLWWNPNEPGWGINVTHQGNVIFATLFTYDANGKGTWFVLSHADRTGTGQYSGTLYRTRGPVFNASPWSAATPTEVGSMSFSFTTGVRGTLTYTVDGVQVTKAIQRETFAAPVTVCQ
jgi:lysyl endopeptidase